MGLLFLSGERVTLKRRKMEMLDVNKLSWQSGGSLRNSTYPSLNTKLVQQSRKCRRAMAAEGGNIEELLKKLCKGSLIGNEILQGCDRFLTEVKVPAKWKGRADYKLQKVHKTYQHREKVIGEFVRRKISQKFKISRKTITQFFDELERFVNSAETNNTLCDLHHDKSCKSRPAISDLFGEDDVKLQGVVVRKSDQNAWVLVKKEQELIIDLQVHEEDTFSTGFPAVKVGDIVEVTRFQMETETILGTDVIW